MGYSCTAAADFTLKALQEKFRHENSGNVFSTDNGKTSYFWEIGRENSDGRITGSVFKQLDNGCARKAGSFAISPAGIIWRFPGVPSKFWRDIEAAGQKAYDERFAGGVAYPTSGS